MSGTSLVTKSERGTLNLWDWVKTGIVSIGTGLLTTLGTMASSGQPLTWQTVKPALIASGAAGVIYLVKQLGTNSDGQIAPENKPGSDKA